MVTIVKHEWHQHDRQYAIELGEDLLSEIYPDYDEDEIASLLEQLENGEADIDEIVEDANDNDIELEWDFQHDDCWTDRKGGYEITYEYGDESSWVEPDKEPEPTHKCVKCKWVGQSYDADWQWPEDDETGEQEAKKVCPMCDSDTELTEVGIEEEKEKEERQARWAKEKAEVSNDEDDEEYSEEGLAEHTKELEDALEELKREFEGLMLEDEETDEEETNEVPASWPFNRPTEGPKTGPVKWPFEKAYKDKVEVTDSEDEEVLPNYPAGEYIIRVWGRTREIGVGTITKDQYDYWSSEEHEDNLSEAMNEDFDYDEANTPEGARFDMPYYEYQDVKSLWGFDEDDTSMTITNSEGVEIYNGDIPGFIQEAHGYESMSQYDATEEVDEMYPHYLGKGTFVVWTQGGKGSCIQTTIVIEEGEEFDPRKFGYKTYDIDGYTIINSLVYDGIDLDDEGMDSEHDNWRGQWSEFNVYENE